VTDMPNSFITNADVLVVEDNNGDIRLLQEAFKEARLNCHLHIARDGEQAMAFLNHEAPYADSPRPALILLDLNLPRKDGREVLAEIKREVTLHQIPVVILTTSTSPEDIRRAYDLHANCYVAKPGDLESLIDLSKVFDALWLKTALRAEA